MIKALFKFSKMPKDFLVIDTTSNSGEYRELSPFILSAPPAKNLENLWQFSKVYKCFIAEHGNPTYEWFEWHYAGFNNNRAIRYPMGKGVIPVYSYWQNPITTEWHKMSYIPARKNIYAPEYAKNVIKTDSFKRLQDLYAQGKDIILLDYDAYDYESLGMNLADVINNPKRKCGHAFILLMMLKNELDQCINS